MKEEKDEWLKVNYMFAVIFFSQVTECMCILQLRYFFKWKPSSAYIESFLRSRENVMIF